MKNYDDVKDMMGEIVRLINEFTTAQDIGCLSMDWYGGVPGEPGAKYILDIDKNGTLRIGRDLFHMGLKEVNLDNIELNDKMVSRFFVGINNLVVTLVERYGYDNTEYLKLLDTYSPGEAEDLEEEIVREPLVESYEKRVLGEENFSDNGVWVRIWKGDDLFLEKDFSSVNIGRGHIRCRVEYISDDWEPLCDEELCLSITSPYRDYKEETWRLVLDREYPDMPNDYFYYFEGVPFEDIKIEVCYSKADGWRELKFDKK